MDKRRFWSLIDVARAVSKGSVAKALERILPNDEKDAFGAILATYLRAVRREDLWAAAYAIRGGMGDDAFDHFRGWLVGQGEAVVEAALRDPESLADLASKEDPRDELMLSFANREAKTMVLDLDWPADRVKFGTEWTDAFFRETYPKLFARFIEPRIAPEPTGEISLDRFWEIIAEARRDANGDAASVWRNLIERFRTAPEAEVVGFETWLNSYNQVLAKRHDLAGAAIVAIQPNDHDSVAGFRGWLLTQGREALERVLTNVDDVGATDRFTSLLAMLMVTSQRLGLGRRGEMKFGPIPELPADWPAAETDERTLRARFPRLAAKSDKDMAAASQDDRDALALTFLERAKAEPENAMSWLDRAAALEPGKGDIHLERSRLLAKQGDDAGALAALGAAIERVPTHAKALLERAQIHAKRGDRELAKSDLEAAARAGSTEAAKLLAVASKPKRVSHKKFGEGAVLSIEETPEGQKLEIDFGAAGKKKLLITFVQVIE